MIFWNCYLFKLHINCKVLIKNFVCCVILQNSIIQMDMRKKYILESISILILRSGFEYVRSPFWIKCRCQRYILFRISLDLVYLCLLCYFFYYCIPMFDRSSYVWESSAHNWIQYWFYNGIVVTTSIIVVFSCCSCKEVTETFKQILIQLVMYKYTVIISKNVFEFHYLQVLK